MAFDTHATYATEIRREDGKHLIEARWPEDAEWIERSRGVSLKSQSLGRGATETDIDSAKVDHALYQKIRLDGSPDLDPDEAKKFIGSMTRCDIRDVSLDGDRAVVDMIVAKGERVRVTMRIPTTAETMQWQRSAHRLITRQHGRHETRTNLQASIDLYGKCALGAEGYANGMPVQHQDAALRAVIDACEAEAEGNANEDF